MAIQKISVQKMKQKFGCWFLFYLYYVTRHATWEFELNFRIEYFIKPQQNIYI
jgi:hypothetical protein